MVKPSPKHNRFLVIGGKMITLLIPMWRTEKGQHDKIQKKSKKNTILLTINCWLEVKVKQRTSKHPKH